MGLMLCNAGYLVAQSAAPTPVVPLPSSPPPSVAAGVFPLDQVRRGLHGVAYTVFEGTRPEAMNVEILGVLHNFLGPGQDLILSRLSGAKPEYTGVVAGMSGSPVYIDGKLLGALSYRIGQFSKEPIAGITPIQQMFQVRDQPSAVPAAPPETANSGAPAVPTSGSPAMQPIETPLVFTGFSPEAIKLWQDHLPASGLTPVAGTGGGLGGSRPDQPQPEPLVPGSAVSAVLVRGDLDIAATCTVTYIDAKQLLACGHPITQFGPVDMPMTKAEVLATLPSPLNAFKIVNTTETVGAFTQDRQSAIGGQLGANARMIPVSVNVSGSNSGASQNPSLARKLHFEVVDNPQITPTAVLVSIYQALLSSNGYAVETTYRMRGSIELEGYPAVHLDSTFAPTEQLPASLIAAFTVAQHFGQIYGNASRLTSIRAVSIDFEAAPGRQSLQIESVRSSATEVHAGDTITVEATVRPWHGEPRNLRVPITVPATLSPGPLRVVVSDAATLDRITLSTRPGGPPLNVADTIAQINGLHPSDRLYITLLEPSPQAVLNGRTLAALPLSMANVLEPLRGNQEMSLNGESAVPAASVAAGGMLTGQQVISLQVE